MSVRRLGGGLPDAARGAVLAAVVRNEALRLPAYLAYYRRLGFGRFVFVDNGSTDGTRELLLAEPGAIVFGTEASFGRSAFGMAWLNPILGQLCAGSWVLLADADELLVWPGGGDIGALTARLDAEGAEALFAVMLDMYSDRPFGGIGYRPGEPLEEACPFFDRGPYRVIRSRRFPYRQAYGGLRARLFRQHKAEFQPPTASKVPLVRWSAGQGFAHVAHALRKPVPLARMRAALLHFKLLDWLKLLLAEDIPPEALRSKDRKTIIPPLHGALLKNEQDVHLFERLVFMTRAKGA